MLAMSAIEGSGERKSSQKTSLVAKQRVTSPASAGPTTTETDMTMFITPLMRASPARLRTM